MHYIVIAIVLVLLSIVGIGVKKAFSHSTDKAPVTSKVIAASTRSELDRMLNEIEKKTAPEGKMGAMCYEVAMIPEYQEYVCPLDGEKTVYDRNTDAWQIVDDIVEMRRLTERINSITDTVDLKLDEKRMCQKCFPDLKNDGRYLVLAIRYPDKKEHVYAQITLDDLRLLTAFFKKLSYTGERDAEIPLKSNRDKIKKILGITEK